MDMGISGKTALVLAGGGGLGSAVATCLAAEGVRVAVSDANASSARDTADHITNSGGDARSLDWDLSDHAAGRDAVTQLEQEGWAIDILVNITGGPPPSPVMGQDLTLWRAQFESMVLSVVNLTDSILPHMRDQRWGRIITSTSSGVVAPIPNLGLSNALRSQLVGWSKTLAREVAKDGVTSNIAVPGRIATPRISFLDRKRAEREGRTVGEVQADSWAAIPVGRYGYPAEYGSAITFLASEHASYITGSVLRVDGGLIGSI